MNSRVAFVKKGLCPRINAAIWVIGLKKKGYNQKNTTKNINLMKIADSSL